VQGAVTAQPFLLTDPGGVTVPLTPPVALSVPDLWRTPLVRDRTPGRNAVVTEPVTPTRDQVLAEHAARRDAIRAEVLQHRAEVERRRQEQRSR